MATELTPEQRETFVACVTAMSDEWFESNPEKAMEELWLNGYRTALSGAGAGPEDNYAPRVNAFAREKHDGAYGELLVLACKIENELIELQSSVDAKVAAAVVAQKGQWQVIETAPKDGTNILANTIGMRRDFIVIVRWVRERWECAYCGDVMTDDQFSHWQALPVPPIRTQPPAAIDTEGRG